METVPENILKQFGLDAQVNQIETIGSGRIHDTFLASGPSCSWIVQRINTNVFPQPEIIASNLKHASVHLSRRYSDYHFLSAILTTDGKEMAQDDDDEGGSPWRLFPYIQGAITLEEVETPEQAYHAAKGFASLTRRLDTVDPNFFRPTIDKFHDLVHRWEQFEEALVHATADRKQNAKLATQQAQSYNFLVQDYVRIVGQLKERIVHNDTKINNILLNPNKNYEAVCVIDLDTLMPGYFIYDLGDMVRTFVSPASEDEEDLKLIQFRKPIYNALLDGYLSEMKDCLTSAELEAIPFAPMMMTFIVAIRFLADYLNGDLYFKTLYPDQNLIRATNQLQLLSVLSVSLPYPSP